MTCNPLDYPFTPPPEDPARIEWLAARKTGIGGSDIAAIMGMSPWRSPLMVYMEKTTGVVSEDSERMLWGRLNEDAVAQETARRVGGKLLSTPGIRRHPGVPYFFASIDKALHMPDGLLGLECKTAGAEQKDKWFAGPPQHYVCQVQWYLMVTGWRGFILSCLFGGNQLRLWQIEPDAHLHHQMQDAAIAFWRMVQDRTPPEATDLDNGILATQYPQDSGCVIPADDELGRLADSYLQAAEALATWQSMKDSHAARIKQILGENLGTEDGRISWKTNKAGVRSLKVKE